MKAARKVLVCLLMLAMLWPVSAALADGSTALPGVQTDVANEEVTPIGNGYTYEQYLRDHEGAARPEGAIELLAKDAFAQDSNWQKTGVALPMGEFDNKQAVVSPDSTNVAWSFSVKQSGLYNLQAFYFPFTEFTYNSGEGQVTLKSKSSAITRGLYIDGQLPFYDARQISFSRVWEDATPIRRNQETDNDIRPFQVEKPIWQTQAVRDSLGYYNAPYLFYLTEGTHTITLTGVREAFAIEKLLFTQLESARPYKDILAEYNANGYQAVPNNADTYIELPAEAATYKSDPTMYPVADRSSPLNQPYSANKIRLNSIGGDKWQTPNSWLEYSFHVKTAGLYQITLKAKQNVLGGTATSRRLYVDGKEFSKETQAIQFMYDTNWDNHVIGGETPYLIYFEEGNHSLRLETTLGDMADIISRAENVILQLNAAYRRVLMLTGSEPDLNATYEFMKNIPDAFAIIAEQNAALKEITQKLTEKYGSGSGEQLTVVSKMIIITDAIGRDPDNIVESFTEFKDTISALSTWINTVRMQPLMMDTIVISSPQAELPRAKANTWEMFLHEVRSFFASFFEDYDNIGGTKANSDDVVVVWVETGAGQAGSRDSANILKQLIDENYTPQSGVDISLRLVAGGSLLPATLAGSGPDVCLSRGSSDPVNFALRGAVENLNNPELFSDIDGVIDNFKPSAMLPLRFRDGIYGLPETQDFLMMFYRDDILKELNLEVPKTWDDVLKVLPVLQNKSMNVGVPVPVSGIVGVSMNLYAMLLEQRGGRIYVPDENWDYDGVTSALTEDASLEAFKMWTNLFVVHQLPNSYDFATRFRSGEMPLAIVGYSSYNLLSVYAPEIQGLWKMTTVPGTVREDGSINSASAGGVASCIMMSTAKNKQNAWDFMKWWVGTEAQALFGREMEAMLGSAARYQTANVEALATLPWDRESYDAIMEQWESVVGVPEVPGSYYTARNLEFAWKEVINNKSDPYVTLMEYSRLINDEIGRKRDEFKDKLDVLPQN